MTLQALVALVIFAVGALAITSISVRQLLATKQAARALARDQLVQTTMADLESHPYDLKPGDHTFDPITVDGLIFFRRSKVQEEEGGKLLLLNLETWIVDKEGQRQSPVWNYEKRVLRL
jgi:hypothetical protein